jgi:hypothetical protein
VEEPAAFVRALLRADPSPEEVVRVRDLVVRVRDLVVRSRARALLQQALPEAAKSWPEAAFVRPREQRQTTMLRRLQHMCSLQGA